MISWRYSIEERPMTNRYAMPLVMIIVVAGFGCGDDATDPDAGDAGPMGADAAGGGGGGGTGSTTVSYAGDVAPIFQSHCVICHHPGGIIGLDLQNPFDAEHGLINQPNSWHQAHDSPTALLVKPGYPDESFLIEKVAADPETFDSANNGSPMPAQLDRVSAQELATIEQWIAAGAKDDSFFAQSVAPIFGTELTLGRKAGRCTYCHYPGSPTGMSVIDVFDPTTGLVNVASGVSDKLRVAPGDPDQSFLIEKLQTDPSGGQQMPLHYPRLTASQVDVLRTWIREGAKNN
jgi:mono/diheme cytochrome c family protein